MQIYEVKGNVNDSAIRTLFSKAASISGAPHELDFVWVHLT